MSERKTLVDSQGRRRGETVAEARARRRAEREEHERKCMELALHKRRTGKAYRIDPDAATSGVASHAAMRKFAWQWVEDEKAAHAAATQRLVDAVENDPRNIRPDNTVAVSDGTTTGIDREKLAAAQPKVSDVRRKRATQ